MKRLFVDNELKNSATVIIGGGDAHHLIYATRVRPGEKFLLVDCKQGVFQGEVTSCTKESVEFKILGEVEDGNTEASIEVVLAQALLKGDKMDFVVQKAVELGIGEIVPVETRNCVVKYDAKKKANRIQKWQKVSEEAAKQCGRTLIPTVTNILELDNIANLYPEHCKIMCYEGEQKPLREVLTKAESSKVLILIGPEGGFTPEEYARCQELGFHTISLGKRILRAETAAIATMSIVMYEAGDLGS